MAKENLTQQNRIGKGTTIIGDIRSDGDFRIEGHIEGNLVTPGRVVIGKTGSVIGTLSSSFADIEGHFSGQLELSETLTLKSTATIEGEVEVGKLSVEPGAVFNASCKMKGNFKDIENGDSKSKKNRKERFA